MSAVQIEPLSSADDTDWLALRMALWPDGDAQEHLEEMADFLKAPSRFAQFIARAHYGRAIGLVEASVRSDYVNGTEHSPVAFLEGLYVVPDARRTGAGRQLVAVVAAWAAKHGCRELASDTPLDNTLSQDVHRALGFVETERVVYFLKELD